MTRESLLRQFEQLEAQALLLAGGIKTLRLAIDEESKPAQAAPEEDADGRCLHPAEYRQAAPSMGNPARFFCGRCKTAGGLRS